MCSLGRHELILIWRALTSRLSRLSGYRTAFAEVVIEQLTQRAIGYTPISVFAGDYVFPFRDRTTERYSCSCVHHISPFLMSSHVSRSNSAVALMANSNSMS